MLSVIFLNKHFGFWGYLSFQCLVLQSLTEYYLNNKVVVQAIEYENNFDYMHKSWSL